MAGGLGDPKIHFVVRNGLPVFESWIGCAYSPTTPGPLAVLQIVPVFAATVPHHVL